MTSAQSPSGLGVEDPLSRLTLVIPSLERPRFLRRQIEYWKDSSVRIIIVDGSAKPLRVENECFGDQVTYHCSNLGMVDRMRLAADLVNTEFVALCGDDDLYLPQGLRTSISLLERDKTLIGALGMSLRLSRRSETCFGQLINLQNRVGHKVSIAGTVRYSRVCGETKLTNQLFGVYRAAEWCKITKTAYGQNYSCAYVHEFSWLVLAAICGCRGVHDDLTWLASAEVPSIVSGAGFRRDLGMLTWLKEPRFSSEVRTMTEKMIEFASRHTETNEMNAADFIARQIDNLVERHEKKSSLLYRVQLQNIALRILRVLSPSMKERAKSVMPSWVKLAIGLNIVPFHDLEKLLTRESINASRAELEAVHRLVLLSNTERLE